jgi:hypothetical protein
MTMMLTDFNSILISRNSVAFLGSASRASLRRNLYVIVTAPAKTKNKYLREWAKLKAHTNPTSSKFKL